MAKKNKTDSLQYIKNKLLLKMKELIESEPYSHALDEFSDFMKGDQSGAWIKKALEIRINFDIPFHVPISIEALKKIVKAVETDDHKTLIEMLKVHRLIQPVHCEGIKGNDPFLLDPWGKLTFKIDPFGHRDIIHHQIDEILNKYDEHRKKKAERSGIPFKKRRFTKERLTGLKVWELRRLRKSFRSIAKELGTTEATAKKQFYRTYETLYGSKYDPARYSSPEIKKEYLKRECSTCTDRDDCTSPCPDVISFIEQDNKYLREFLK